jgi:SAM-dependent methyltransferase
MTEAEPFRSGKYFEHFQNKIGRDHVDKLAQAYEDTFALLFEHNYPNPLRQESPLVLQMGTAGYSTSATFVDFVHGENPKSRIVIADISSYPLTDCLVEGLDTDSTVRFTQADALALPFADNSFDLIETDGLLQFLPDRQQAFSEWARVLKPEGMLTTREWLRKKTDFHLTRLAHAVRLLNMNKLGVNPTIPYEEDIQQENC